MASCRRTCSYARPHSSGVITDGVFQARINMMEQMTVETILTRLSSRSPLTRPAARRSSAASVPASASPRPGSVTRSRTVMTSVMRLPVLHRCARPLSSAAPARDSALTPTTSVTATETARTAVTRLPVLLWSAITPRSTATLRGNVWTSA